MADFSVEKVELPDTADNKKASDMNPKPELTATDNYKYITSTPANTAAKDESQPQPPFLLGIARELRDKIYRFVLVEPSPVIERIFRPNEVRGEAQIDTAILVVNKQIIAESREVLYKNNTFRVGILSSRWKVLRAASNLSIHLQLKQRRWIGEAMFCFLPSCTDLKNLQLNIYMADPGPRDDFTWLDCVKCGEKAVSQLGSVKVKKKVEILVDIERNGGADFPIELSKRLDISMRGLEVVMLANAVNGSR